MNKQIYVNLPVKDLERSKAFFGALGFGFNPQFSDQNAACMIGNSSAGVREAPFLGLPSLDVGTRQTNRAEAPSVIACKASDRTVILDFLRSHWGRPTEQHEGFGTGSAAERFVEILSRPEFWQQSLQKAFRDQN